VYRNREDGHPARLDWKKFQSHLVDNSKGDILVIMDACYAGAANKLFQLEGGRTYEFLGAVAKDRLTPGPGEWSFTTALIKAMKHLLKERNNGAFTTSDLVDIIAKDRHKNPPYEYLRHGTKFNKYNFRRIALAPLMSTSEERKKSFKDAPIASHLMLRIELRHEPNELEPEQIVELAKRVSRAVKFSDLDTRRVDWMSVIERKPRTMKEVIVRVCQMLRTRKAWPQHHHDHQWLHAPSSALTQDMKENRQWLQSSSIWHLITSDVVIRTLRIDKLRCVVEKHPVLLRTTTVAVLSSLATYFITSQYLR
jgi:hypothetical protein